jgi:hypothetical protein
MSAAPPRVPSIPLEPGEEFLWSGAPDQRSVGLKASVAARRRAAVATAVALLLAVAAVRDAAALGMAATWLAVLAAAAAILFALWPMILVLRARRTLYAITSRRLLIHEGFPLLRLRSFAREELAPLQVERIDERHGDVLFALETEAIGHPSCGCGAGLCPTPSGKVTRVTEIRDRRIETPVGFRAIANPDAVADLIRRQFGIPSGG